MINSSQPDYHNTPVCINRSKYTYERAGLGECPFPTVTIVTSLSCQCNFFDETAASVFAQSMQDWEWIIAEGSASAGGSPIIARTDTRVRVMPGQYDTEQDLFHQAESARAPLIIFLACGDLLEPTALEKLLWFLESHPEYAFARGYSVGFGGSNCLFREHIHGKHMVMFRRAAFLDIEDAGRDFWAQCTERGYFGGTVPEFLSWHRLTVDEHAWQSDKHLNGGRAVWRNVVPRSTHVSRTSPQDAGAPSNHITKPTGKRRLLMLAPHLEIGGTDKFNLDLIACLQRNHSYEVSVVTTLSSADRWRDSFERLTPDVFTLHTFLPVEDYARFISYLIQSRKPDTVLITNSRIAYQLLPFLRTGSGASFIDYLHIENWDPQGYPQLSLSYASLLDSTIVSSEYLKRRLVEAGGDPNRIHVSTTNIDPEFWARSDFDVPNIRAKYGVPEGTPVIVFVARLYRQKQPDVMAAALKTLRDRRLQFACLIAGEGPSKRWLEKFLQKHRLSQVKLLGAVPSEQVREILAIGDIFFMPSANEGIALALFEAMSMGVPPVAADVGGQAELVSADCGILIKPGLSQIVEYANGLQRLLTDHELRASMGSRSRERICAHFTLDEMGNKMAELIESAARNSTFDPGAVRKDWGDSQEMISARRLHRWFMGFKATTLLLFSPRNFSLKLKNLNLLTRILFDQRKRIRLADTFDARYYLSNNPDLKVQGVMPLLHYSLQGYLEDRQPGPQFDSAACRHQYPGIIENPMLWSIVHEDAY